MTSDTDTLRVLNHGKPSTYNKYGCRCVLCTFANTRERRRYRASVRPRKRFLCVLLTAVLVVAGLSGCAPYPMASSVVGSGVDVCDNMQLGDILDDIADTVAEGQFVAATLGHGVEYRNLERQLVDLIGLSHTTGCMGLLQTYAQRNMVDLCVEAAANAAVDPGPCYRPVPAHSLSG